MSTMLEELTDDRAVLVMRYVDIEALAEKIAAKINTVPAPEKDEQPISQAEAMKYMGKSRQTFYAWRRKGIVKGHQLGGQIYFFKSELNKILR